MEWLGRYFGTGVAAVLPAAPFILWGYGGVLSHNLKGPTLLIFHYADLQDVADFRLCRTMNEKEEK